MHLAEFTVIPPEKEEAEKKKNLAPSPPWSGESHVTVYGALFKVCLLGEGPDTGPGSWKKERSTAAADTKTDRQTG